MPLTYPMVNGNRFDWSSVDVGLDGVIYPGVKSIKYGHSLTPGLMRGNRPAPQGRTRGKYEVDASMEMYRSEAQRFIDALSAGNTRGFLEVPFEISVSYNEPTTPDLLIVDVLRGCRIMKTEDGGGEGEEPLVTKMDLSVLLYLPNGKTPIHPLKASL